MFPSIETQKLGTNLTTKCPREMGDPSVQRMSLQRIFAVLAVYEAYSGDPVPKYTDRDHFIINYLFLKFFFYIKCSKLPET